MKNHRNYYNKRKKTVKRKVKPSVIIFTYFFSVFILASISGLFIYRSVSNQIVKLVYYNEKSNLDYKVFLKPNNYFDEKFLGKGKQYIANLIDYIEFDFNYLFNVSDPLNYQYKYYAVVDILATEKGAPSKILFTKSEKILEETIVNMMDSQTYEINKALNIDYVKYNNLITAFKKDYILTLDSHLTILFYVETIGNNDNFVDDINTKQVMKINMPLSEQTIDIAIDYNDINDSSVAKERIPKRIIVKNMMIGGTIGLIAFIVLIFAFVYIHKLGKRKTNYMRKLEKIRKEYDKVIVNSKNIPILTDYDIVEVESFEEMIDARQNLDSNIIHIELMPKHESLFIIINDKLAYIYVLNDDKNA